MFWFVLLNLPGAAAYRFGPTRPMPCGATAACVAAAIGNGPARWAAARRRRCCRGRPRITAGMAPTGRRWRPAQRGEARLTPSLTAAGPWPPWPGAGRAASGSNRAMHMLNETGACRCRRRPARRGDRVARRHGDMASGLPGPVVDGGPYDEPDRGVQRLIRSAAPAQRLLDQR